MELGLVLLVIVTVLGAAGVALARRRRWTHGAFAWRSAQAACVAFALSIAVYAKPQSFYTNFVIVPAVTCFLSGLLLVLVTLVLGVLALVKKQDARRGLTACAMSLIATVVTLAVIAWRAS